MADDDEMIRIVTIGIFSVFFVPTERICEPCESTLIKLRNFPDKLI